MKQKILIVAVVSAVVLCATGWWYWPFGPDRNTLQLPGTVEIQEVRLGSKVGGRVEEVLVRESQVVEAGTILVRLAAPELRASKQQWEGALQAAEAELAKAKAGPRTEQKDEAVHAVSAAKARYLRLKNGARVEEKDQASAELNRAEVEVKLANQRVQRLQKLVNGNISSREEFDSATADLHRAQALVGSARARLQLLENGSRQEDIDEAEAEMRRAQAKLDELLAGSRAEDIALAEGKVREVKGRLAEVEAKLEETIVRAPEKAVVEVVGVRKGDIAQPNQALVRVLRADDLWVKVFVPETQLGKIRLGQEVQVRVDGYPDKRFTGTVVQIASVSEFTPRNVQSADERRHQVFGVRVRVDDPQGVFKAGMAADVWLPLE
jgi:multidrug resistance efflux pump